MEIHAPFLYRFLICLLQAVFWYVLGNIALNQQFPDLACGMIFLKCPLKTSLPMFLLKPRRTTFSFKLSPQPSRQQISSQFLYPVQLVFSLTSILVFPLYFAVIGEASTAMTLMIAFLIAILAGTIALLWMRLKAYRKERDRLRDSLSQAIEQTQVMLHTIRDGVITANAQGRVELLNPVAEQITGWHTQEAQGRSLSEILPLRDCNTGQPLPNLIADSYEQRSLSNVDCAALLQTRDHSERRVNSTQVEIHAPTGQVTSSVVVLREAAAVSADDVVSTWQDRYDALTGLVNRQEFEHCLQQAIALTQANDQEHSLCFLDLDRFREINQACGYTAGDELLRQVSRLLQNKVRRADTIARLGGDEFAVLLYRCPTEQAMYVAHSLCEAIEKFWFEWEGQKFSVGVSIGLVSLAAKSDAASAIRAADKACAIAKTQNRGGVHFYQND